MGRMFVANFKGVAVTVQQDFFELLAASSGIVVIHEWGLSQTTEFGDAAEEQLLLTTNRGEGTVTSGSGGTAPTARPIDRGSGAAATTVEANNTTKMATGTGTLIELEAHAWNVRVPFQRIYTPESRPIIRPSDRWTLELETTPVDSITINGYVIFEEIG